MMTYSSLYKKEDFFHVLNLVATKNVKIKYCRTIKERLRAKTQEEGLTLPSKSKPKSPVKRKAEDVKPEPPSPEKVQNIELKGGLCYLQSYKNKKRARIKERHSVSPPSSKSLLSYLHHKQADTDSSCPDSDSGEPPRPRQPAAAISNGFSEESATQSRLQTRGLEQIISGLEQEESQARGLEVVEAKDVVMRMVEDFSLLSESDSEDELVESMKDPSSLVQPVTFLKPTSFQIDDRSEAGGDLVSEEDLLLREMLARYEKLDEGRAEDLFENKFSDANLNGLVTRVRRESKIFRSIQAQYKQKRKEKGKILSRCNYFPSNVASCNVRKPYSVSVLREEKKSFTRLQKPSSADILLARKINKIDMSITPTIDQPKSEILVPENVTATEQTDQLDSLNNSSVDDFVTAETAINSSQSDENLNEAEMQVEAVESVKGIEDVELQELDTGQPNKYICEVDVCQKEFSTKNGLDYHERTHSGVSPYQCDVCDKTFKSSSLCSRHKLIHSESKNFCCNICSKSFAQKSNLSKHLDIHAGTKPFICPDCSKSFTQKVHLDCHSMTHSKQRPWECEQCGSKFTKKSSLSRHVQNLHDTEAVETVTGMIEAPDDAEVTEPPEDQKSPDVNGAVEPIGQISDDQFDVEVSYCDNLQMLDVNHQTYFIIDNYDEGTREETNVEDMVEGAAQGEEAPDETEVFEELESVIATPLKENAEQIEDIQKFLAESEMEDQESDAVENSVLPDENPKSNSGNSNIEFTKESALKIISQSSFFVKNNVKNELKTPKVHSFEEALNAALTPSRKPIKTHPVKNQKKIVQRAVVAPVSECNPNKKIKTSNSSNSDLLSVNSTDRQKLKVKKKAVNTVKSVDVVSKIMAEQSKSFNSGQEDKKKPLMNPPIKSTEPESRIKLEKPRGDKESFLRKPSYEEIYNSLKKTILKTQERSPPEKFTSPLSPIKTIGQVSPKKQKDTSPNSYNDHNGLLNPTLNAVSEAPRSTASLPAPVPASTDPGLRLTSVATYKPRDSAHSTINVPPVKRGESQGSQGYYTSSSKSSPPKVKAETPSMAPKTAEAPCATLLPSVFPTFDSPSSSPGRSLSSLSLPGIASILQSASKPTAVVPPSTRPKLKMPALPKPVPAAIGCNPLCADNKLSGSSFVCNRCGENFHSNSHLISHQQSKHFYENF